jgi:hypothetical protein
LGDDREVVRRIRVFAWVGSKGEAAYFCRQISTRDPTRGLFTWFCSFFFPITSIKSGLRIVIVFTVLD